MQKQFSYVVQYTSFGSKDELWDANGAVLAQISTHGVRLAEDSPDDGGGGRGRGNGNPNDPKRGIAWMPQGTGLYYLRSQCHPSLAERIRRVLAAPRVARVAAWVAAGGAAARRGRAGWCSGCRLFQTWRHENPLHQRRAHFFGGVQ